MNENGPIIFYDGTCGMCHGFVRFAIRRDRRSRFFFAPIGGETWCRRFGDSSSRDQETIHLLSEERTYVRSSAVCRVLVHLGTTWRILGGALWMVPLPLRNIGYRMVARIRHRIAGREDTCTLPDADAVDRLLP